MWPIAIYSFIYQPLTPITHVILIGQKFTRPEYFWGGPSAADYNASASAGSNKGPSNPEYLATVQARIDTFLIQNPDVPRAQVPSELVTASGSGLDPHLTVAAATIQAPRIAAARHISISAVDQLIAQHTQGALVGLFGPKDLVNVLQLNLALDKLSSAPVK